MRSIVYAVLLILAIHAFCTALTSKKINDATYLYSITNAYLRAVLIFVSSIINEKSPVIDVVIFVLALTNVNANLYADSIFLPIMFVMTMFSLQQRYLNHWIFN